MSKKCLIAIICMVGLWIKILLLLTAEANSSPGYATSSEMISSVRSSLNNIHKLCRANACISVRLSVSSKLHVSTQRHL